MPNGGTVRPETGVGVRQVNKSLMPEGLFLADGVGSMV